MTLKDYIVLDLETTGLSKNYHKITEIAAIKVSEGEIVEKFETLVNPVVPIPKEITRLTGITDEMVAGAPQLEDVLPSLKDFLSDHIIVAHNATFDHGFIDHNYQKFLEMPLSNARLCTKKLANRLFPDLPSKRLSFLCQHFGVENENAHRAMSDVMATNTIFQKMMRVLQVKDFTKEDVLMFERSSIRFARNMLL